MQYKKITQAQIIRDCDTTSTILQEVKHHALGSLYRMNAQSADCYAFTPDTYMGKKSFNGGWDWKNYLVDKNASYIFDLTDHQFYEVI